MYLNYRSSFSDAAQVSKSMRDEIELYTFVLNRLLTKPEKRPFLELFKSPFGCATPSNSPTIDDSEHDTFAASRGVGI
jgi:hypothetical protein